jgi:hypothetical protein
MRRLRVRGAGRVREPAAAVASSTAPGAPSVYRFIWAATRKDQVWLCLMTLLVVPVSMVPLELQRRITNEAIGRRHLGLLALLGLAYLAAILLQGGLKYRLNLRRGRVVEVAALELRRLIHAAALAGGGGVRDRGALVSMAAAEAEDVALVQRRQHALHREEGGERVAEREVVRDRLRVRGRRLRERSRRREGGGCGDDPRHRAHAPNAAQNALTSKLSRSPWRRIRGPST